MTKSEQYILADLCKLRMDSTTVFLPREFKAAVKLARMGLVRVSEVNVFHGKAVLWVKLELPKSFDEHGAQAWHEQADTSNALLARLDSLI